MENTGAAGATSSTPATDATPSAANYEEDAASRHFATTASQVPVPTGSLPSPPPPPPPQPAPAAIPSMPPLETGLANLKDAQKSSHGTRFHEECHETDLPSPRLKSSRLFKGKGKEAVSVEKEKKKPLNLLDLPVDILKDVVKEVTHTNDLTSLALCHSALHRLTTPHIYSRFDIVWPDTNTHAEPRSGVDALTYGLATLVMAEEIFGEAPHQRQQATQANRFALSGQGRANDMAIRRRRGNHYAQFTRKFSLGNGPADWVQEYLITKEGGKMLGTLVALAVARMRALETFVWDMPTGILRDVWLALSSLGDKDDGMPCRLEKVWVRWHDNSSADSANGLPPPPPPINPNHTTTAPPAPLPTTHTAPLPPLHQHHQPPQLHHTPLDRLEHPSFSVLPALKSLSVLDIDELAYLDEMAVLIGRSLTKLRELRVGIARHATNRDWVTVWEGEGLRQVDERYTAVGSLTVGEKRLGGVLGVLTGLVCDLREPERPRLEVPERRRSVGLSRAKSPVRSADSAAGAATSVEAEAASSTAQEAGASEITSLRDMFSEVPAGEAPPETPASPNSTRSMLGSESAFENDPLVAQCSRHSTPLLTPNSEPQELIQNSSLDNPSAHETSIPSHHQPFERPYLDNKLLLESLELERVPLSVPLLQKAIDWTRLTSLTLLGCQNQEQLWKTLRRTYAPTPKSPTYPHPRRSLASTPKKAGRSSFAGSDVELEYGLKLKKVHTNTVSPALISFLKDTLAPNSLEVLFLQESRSFNSSVTIDQIFKGPLRRHRGSLKKLLIDSSEKPISPAHGADGGGGGLQGGPGGMPAAGAHPGGVSGRWRRWIVGREILSFLCSGKCPALRELGVGMEYRDWHFFLQHLPSIPHLRSLSIPFLADHVHGADVDPRELALQIVDIVALRPEVELCYMGIANKCFEILENRRNSSSSDAWDGRPESRMGGPGGGMEDDEDAGAGSEGEEDDEGVEDEDVEDAEAEVETESEDEEEEDEGDDDTDSDAGSDEVGSGGGRGTARLRLREILFYDDKVAIFKARHGRL